MQTKLTKKLIYVLGAGVLVLGGLFFVSSQAPAAPTIAWTPNKIVEAVLPGEERTIGISFLASKSLADVVVRVVPALEPYVTVSPAVINNVFKGETVELTVVLSVDPNALPKFATGTIQLRSATKPAKTLARPLPVSLIVIGQLGVSPLQLTAGVPTPVFTEMTFPTKPSDVRLERLHDDGTIGMLGKLRDDGQGGDLLAGDGKYAISTLFDELSGEVIRLRANARFDTPEELEFISPEQSIVVLPTVLSTGAEELLQDVVAALQAAKSVDDMLPFITPRLVPTFQLFLDNGVPLAELAPLFQNATLMWKTHQRAEFEVIIELSTGKPVRASIVVHKFDTGWKIVTF